jgi:hypothetical protein
MLRGSLSTVERSDCTTQIEVIISVSAIDAAAGSGEN